MAPNQTTYPTTSPNPPTPRTFPDAPTSATPRNRQRVAILDVSTGEVKWVDPGLENREVQLQAPVWNEQGTHAVMVARSTDNKDRWILALDPSTGKTARSSLNTTTRG